MLTEQKASKVSIDTLVRTKVEVYIFIEELVLSFNVCSFVMTRQGLLQFVTLINFQDALLSEPLIAPKTYN